MLLFSHFINHGIRHCITLRCPGFSQSPFNSNNLSYSVGDIPENVTKNRNQVSAHFGLTENSLYLAHQVHGSDIASVDNATADLVSTWSVDGLICTTPDSVVGVLVADCFPILIASRDGLFCGAVHAGRKGTELGIVHKVIKTATTDYGISQDKLLIGIGPGICEAHYPVDADTARAFIDNTGKLGVYRLHGKQFHLNLRRTIHNQLLFSGIKDCQIENLDLCTYEQDDTFYSYRRDNRKSGRFGAFVSVSKS